MQVPFKAPPESVMRLEVDDGKDVFGRGIETVSLPLADQFALQADNLVELCVREPPPTIALKMQPLA